MRLSQPYLRALWRSFAVSSVLAGVIAAMGAVALAALARHVVPGVATLDQLDPDCAGLPISAAAQTPRSNVALILCRGFAGTNAALLVRAV